MPRGSEELTNARKEEIINACASLYETMSFRDITIRDIGEKTSFTRTSIYNYFQTREEIFLALLKREHEMWSADLEEILRTHDTMSVEAFADALAATLEKRSCMLKLMSMNLYDMESNSRMENLVEFKKAYAGALGAVRRCMEKFFLICPLRTYRSSSICCFRFCSAYIRIRRLQKSSGRLWSLPMWSRSLIPSVRL